MAFSSATLSQYSLSCLSSSHPYPQTPQIQRKIIITNPHWKALSIRAAANAAEPEKKQKISQNPIQDSSSSSSSIKTQTSSIKMPKKPVYSMKKGQIVRVDKEKYLNSINYLSVGHPPYYKGLDYIYEDRGEVLDIRIFETGEYALIAWVGIPTAPAWLPTDMLIKSDRLDYERI